MMRPDAGLRPVHWFFRRSDGQWAAYSDDDSDALECACAECRHECTLSGANHKVRQHVPVCCEGARPSVERRKRMVPARPEAEMD